MPKCQSCGVPTKLISSRRKLEATVEKLKEQNKTLREDRAFLKRRLAKSERISDKAKTTIEDWRAERKKLTDAVQSLEGRLRTSVRKHEEAVNRAETYRMARRTLALKLRDIQQLTKGVIW